MSFQYGFLENPKVDRASEVSGKQEKTETANWIVRAKDILKDILNEQPNVKVFYSDGSISFNDFNQENQGKMHVYFWHTTSPTACGVFGFSDIPDQKNPGSKEAQKIAQVNLKDGNAAPLKIFIDQSDDKNAGQAFQSFFNDIVENWVENKNGKP